MSSQVMIREREQAALLSLIGDILRLDWNAVGSDEHDGEHHGMSVTYAMDGNRLDEVIVTLPDQEGVYVAALRAYLGKDTEIATCRRRVHRWLAGGREVLLDSCCGSGCRLIID